MKLLSMRCTNCGADLEMDLDKRQGFCPYCGTKLLLDDDHIRITNRIVDEARLKEAEVRLRELEYRHERELQELNILRQQKKVRRIVLAVFAAMLLITFFARKDIFWAVLILGLIAMGIMRSSDKPAAARTQSYSTSPKSRGTALLLCIFLGTFGIHYFYVGKLGMGILYLFTLGFLGVGWMIDIVRILCGIFRDRDGLYLR